MEPNHCFFYPRRDMFSLVLGRNRGRNIGVRGLRLGRPLCAL